MLSYRFEWQRAEHADVVRLLTREMFSSGFRRALKWLIFAVLAVEAAYVLVMVSLGQGRSVATLLVLLAVTLPLLIFFYRIAGQLRAWQAQRLDPAVRGPLQHELDDAGYHVLTGTARIDLRWDGLYKVRETERFFLAYYSRHFAYYLPKRALAVEDVQRVRSFIQARLPESVPYQRDR